MFSEAFTEICGIVKSCHITYFGNCFSIEKKLLCLLDSDGLNIIGDRNPFKTAECSA